MRSAVIISIAYFLFPLRLFSQCQNINFPVTCTTLVYTHSCPTWADGCGAGWTRSHGTPELKTYTVIDPKRGIPITEYYGYMWSSTFGGHTIGEGMFTAYPFVANQIVQITVRASTSLSTGTGTGGVVDFYATKNLAQGLLDDSCGNAIPNIPSTQKQLIGVISGINNNPTDFTFTFTPAAGSSWTEIWMYPQANSANQYNLSVFNIEICPSCAGTVIYNVGTIPSGQTTAGTISVGSSAGSGGSGTVSVSPTQATALIATTVVNMLPSFQATVTGNGSFAAKINPCGYVPPISTDYINYDSVNVITTPTIESDNIQGLGGIAGTANVFNQSGKARDPNTQISIYPSVSAGLVNISGNSQSLANTDLIVYDNLGKIVLRLRNTENTNIVMDLSNLSSGIYFLQIRNNSKNPIIKKLIINK